MNKIITEAVWGKTADGHDVQRHTISNGKLSVSLIDLGATVQRIIYNGLDMALSFPDPGLYERISKGCIGATVGRYAGRIAGGKCSIDGAAYQLTQNQNGNHLHGGEHGFHTKLWKSEIIDGEGIRFSLFSPDGEEGYPGNLNVNVVYRVTDDNSLEITFNAASDKDTILNLTNHSYFNPNGFEINFPDFRTTPSTDNSDTELQIHADRVLELDGDIPTGKLLPVDGTQFDFRSRRPLTSDIREIPGKTLGGFDHTFAFSPHEPEQPVAEAIGRKSGVKIAFFTDQPGAQLFTMGNPGIAFAFEAQHFPDSPHHPGFPSTVLRAGDVFRSRTIYRFSKE